MKIFLIGMPLAGKSTIGYLLSKQLNYVFIDTDDELKKLGVSLNIDLNNQSSFRNMETKLYQQGFIDNSVIATGGGIVYNLDNFKYLDGLIIYLNTSINILEYRYNKYNHVVYNQISVKELYRKRHKKYLENASYAFDNTNDILQTVRDIYEIVQENLNH